MEKGKNLTKFVIGLLISMFLSVNAYAVTGIGMPPTSLIVNYDLSQIDELEQGETGNAVIVIQNVGNFEAKEVEVVVHDTQYLSANSYWKLGTIGPGRSVSIVIPIKASKDAKPGINFLTLSMNYKSYSMNMYGMMESEEVKSDWLISVKVKGNPLFYIKNFYTDKNPEPGKKFNITIYFENNKGEAEDTFIAVGNNADNGNNGQNAVSAYPQSQSASAASYLQMTQMQQAQIMALQKQKASDSSVPSTSSVSQSSSINNVLSVVGINKKFLGNIKQGSEISAKFEIYVDEKASSGLYNLPVKLTYKDGSTKKTDEFTIGIFVSGEENIIISEVRTEQDKIYPKDKDVKLILKIQNTGTKEVDYLKISPVFAFPFKNSKSYSQTKDIGKLNPGDEKEADFYVDIDDSVKEGAYNLIFRINYKTDNIIKEQNISASIEIHEKPNFEISYAPKTVTGKKDSIKLTIKNKGSDCDDVKIYTIKQTDIPFDWTTTSQYIGNLKNNEEGEVVLEFSVKENAKEQTYLTPVEIRCVKNDAVFTQSEKIKIEVNKKSAEINYLYVVALAIVIILIALIAKFKFKK